MINMGTVPYFLNLKNQLVEYDKHAYALTWTTGCCVCGPHSSYNKKATERRQRACWGGGSMERGPREKTEPLGFLVPCSVDHGLLTAFLSLS